MEGRSWLPFAIAGVVIVGVLVWLGMRHGSANAASAGSGIADEPVVAPTFAPTARPAAVAPTPDPVAPAPAPTAPSGPPPAEVARQLKDSLDRQRLWATVSIVGGALEVRSASCADPAMASTLDGASANAHAAGLSQLRCVSRSGAVVSTRAL